jgi:hypothetical protein
VCLSPWSLGHVSGLDNGDIGEASQDTTPEDVGAGVGEDEVNIGGGDGGSDGAGMDAFSASWARRPLDTVKSKLVSLDWFCVARRCLGHR